MSRRQGDSRARRARSGTFTERERVQSETEPVLDRWQSAVALETVRRRLNGIVSAGLVVIAIHFLLNPGGIAGILVLLWFLLSVPVIAVAACLLVLLKDPSSAPEMWWDHGIPATVGLISLAFFARIGRVNPIGRAVWQFFFGSDHPEDDNYQFGSGGSKMDFSAVARIRRYVWFAVVGSTALILTDLAIRNDVLGAGTFEWILGTDPGIAGWIGLAVLLAGIGLGLGTLAAAMDL